MTVALLGGSLLWCSTDAPETQSWFVSLWQLRHVMWDCTALVCGRMTAVTVSAWSHTGWHWPLTWLLSHRPGRHCRGNDLGAARAPCQDKRRNTEAALFNQMIRNRLVKAYSKSKRFYERWFLKLKSSLLKYQNPHVVVVIIAVSQFSTKPMWEHCKILLIQNRNVWLEETDKTLQSANPADSTSISSMLLPGCHGSSSAIWHQHPIPVRQMFAFVLHQMFARASMFTLQAQYTLINIPEFHQCPNIVIGNTCPSNHQQVSAVNHVTP